MSLPRTIQKIPPPDKEFAKTIGAEVTNLNRCYQCSMCSDGCPLAYAMDYVPNQLIHMVRIGLKDMVLKSTTIWLCASCETCATRCPNEIDIVGLMDTLRAESRREGVNPAVNKVIKFHEAFVGQIKMKGRIDEAFLMADYELKTWDFLSVAKIKELAGMAFGMIKRRKMKVPSLKRYSHGELKTLFKRVFSPGR